MKSLEKNLIKFESLNTMPVGVSVDTTPSKKAWAESLDIKRIRLLSDFWPHGEVAKLYGIFGRRMVSQRGPTSSSMRTRGLHS
jgi:peroxiredoxin